MQAETNAHVAETRALQAETNAYAAKTRALQAETNAYAAETRALQTEMQLQAVYTSTSWRITAPLRMVGSVKKSLFSLPKTINFKIKEKLKLLLAHSKHYINRRPKCRYIALAIFKPFPALKRDHMQAYLNASSEEIFHPHVEEELINLSPRASIIYVNLKDIIKRRQKENG